MNSLPTIPLFPADKIVATSGPLALLQEANKIPASFSRVTSAVAGAQALPGRQGENKLSFKHGFRSLSGYKVAHTKAL